MYVGEVGEQNKTIGFKIYYYMKSDTCILPFHYSQYCNLSLLLSLSIQLCNGKKQTCF